MSAALEARPVPAGGGPGTITRTGGIAVNAATWTIDRARDEVSASSAGGAPFLIAFGLTLALTAVASVILPLKVAAIVALFQGNLALPLAFALERRLGHGPMSPENPLKGLSVLLAMSQIVALPVVVLVYAMQPAYVPAALAAIGGGHFLPYAWLQRTRIYTVLGVVVAVGALAIALTLQRESFAWVLGFMTLSYWVAAPMLIAHARRVAAAPGAGR